jgi:hypothetical protein
VPPVFVILPYVTLIWFAFVYMLSLTGPAKGVPGTDASVIGADMLEVTLPWIL